MEAKRIKNGKKERGIMQAHLVISGYVQGVGFRQFVRRTAKKLGLNGWVCNIENGKVEVLFQGEKEIIEKAIEESRKGPFLSEVKDIEVKWIEENDSSIIDFKIVH